MKLIDRRILEINIEACVKNKKFCSEVDWGKLIGLCELSPADLKSLGLGALEVLEELKEKFSVPEEDDAKDKLSSAFILRLIQVLESSAEKDLGELRKIQVKAKAWDMFWNCEIEVLGIEWQGEGEYKDHVLAQARAELSQKGEEKK